MKNKQMAGWAAILAVLVVFLMSVTVLGNERFLGVSGTVAVITGIGFLYVGVLAAIVGIYWARR